MYVLSFRSSVNADKSGQPPFRKTHVGGSV
jgi:hypothetical protein